MADISWKGKIMEAVNTHDAVLLDKLTKTYRNSMLDYWFRNIIREGNNTVSLSIDSPLSKAVRSGHYDMTKQLLKAGANVDYDIYSVTPLMMAVERGMVDMCKLLLEYGASIRRRDCFRSGTGKTALGKAIINNHHHVVSLCLEHGALYFNSKEKLNKWLLDKDTPLYHAIFNKSRFPMELLLNHLGKYGWDIPLHSFFRLASSQSEDCAMSLLQRGHNPLQRKCSECVKSCFATAAEGGHIQLMRLMIELNPMFLQEDWLVKNTLPTKLTQHADFLSWLLQHRSQPPQLIHLCRTVMLVELGQNYLPKIGELPLPKPLKAFLCVVDNHSCNKVKRFDK